MIKRVKKKYYYYHQSLIFGIDRDGGVLMMIVMGVFFFDFSKKRTMRIQDTADICLNAQESGATPHNG